MWKYCRVLFAKNQKKNNNNKNKKTTTTTKTKKQNKQKKTAVGQVYSDQNVALSRVTDLQICLETTAQ